MTDYSNSSNDGAFVQSSYSSKQENCLKSIQTLEVEKEKISASLELVKTKLEMQNSLLKQYNENKKLFDENTKLSTNLDILNSDLIKYKKENELNLEEMTKIKKEKEELIDKNEEILNENILIKNKLEELTTNFVKFKEDLDTNLENLNKIGEENQKLKNNVESAENELSQLKSEKLEKQNKFEEEMQNVLVEKKKAIDQADILKIEHKRVYDLYTIQQTEFKDIKIQNENLASENKKLKLDFENLQEENGNLKLINDSFNTKISKLTSDIEKKRMHFVKIENKINRISSQFTCCESKCINNSNLSNGTCFNGNGIIRVQDDGKVKYFMAKNEEKNNLIRVYAQHLFNKSTSFYHCYSLFYFEVTIIKETTDTNQIVSFGLVDMGDGPGPFETDAYLCLDNSTSSPDSSGENGDVYGCGLVIPPKNESETQKTFVFFTKNGTEIGEEILIEEDVDILKPFIKLKSCSVEVNFGNDLETKPFRYDIYKHF